MVEFNGQPIKYDGTLEDYWQLLAYIRWRASRPDLPCDSGGQMTEYEYVPLVGWQCPQCLAITNSEGRCNCGVNQGLRVRTRNAWDEMEVRNQQTYENLVESTPRDLGVEPDVKFKRFPPGEAV